MLIVADYAALSASVLVCHKLSLYPVFFSVQVFCKILTLGALQSGFLTRQSHCSLFLVPFLVKAA